VPCGSVGGHFARWHNGHGETAEVIVSPSVTGLIGDAIHLPHAALERLALAFLAEVRDRVTRRLNEINLDLVMRVLDDGGGHGCLADELSIAPRRAVPTRLGTVPRVA